jgi:sortase A
MSKEHASYLFRGDGIKFVFYPIILFAVTVGLCAAILLPVFSPYLNLLDLFLLDRPPEFGENQLGIYADTVSKQPPTRLPLEGENYGTITIESAGIDAPVIYGDTPKDLIGGVGTYTGGYTPGLGGTIIMAGHNNTWFRTLPQAEIGDIIKITTYYGEFYYEISDIRHAKNTDSSTYDLAREDENLILYTCENSIPFGATPDRLFVYGDYLQDRSEFYDTEGES